MTTSKTLSDKHASVGKVLADLCDDPSLEKKVTDKADELDKQVHYSLLGIIDEEEGYFEQYCDETDQLETTADFSEDINKVTCKECLAKWNKEQKPFVVHEAMDRTCILGEMVEISLEDNAIIQGNPELKHKYEEIGLAIGELYQLIGQHME